MKYYLYVSDAKVDMLFPQVPHEVKKKVATEWKLDLKVLGMSRRTEVDTEDTRFARLDAVVAFVREFGSVGSADEPLDYVSDTLEMRWGYLGGFGGKEMPLVYFGGQTDRTVVGLGGSARHVIGNVGLSTPYSHSAMPFLTTTLVKDLGLGLEEVHTHYNLADPGHGYDALTRRSKRTEGKFRDVDEKFVFEAVFAASVEMKGPAQTVEFLAKRLLHGLPKEFKYPPNVANILLGTPLYVALAE
jgi:hypothetical protein